MNAALERFRAWWSSLVERERRVLSVGGAALALIVLYVGVWEPLSGAVRRGQNELQAARAMASQLETLATAVPRAGGATAGADQSLLAVIDQSRKSSAITKPPSRLQPEGDNTVRIWLEDVPFDGLMRWIGELQARYGVRVESVEIERESGPGLVNARLTLMRG